MTLSTISLLINAYLSSEFSYDIELCLDLTLLLGGRVVQRQAKWKTGKNVYIWLPNSFAWKLGDQVRHFFPTQSNTGVPGRRLWDHLAYFSVELAPVFPVREFENFFFIF